jgi:hypothetical protein
LLAVPFDRRDQSNASGVTTRVAIAPPRPLRSDRDRRVDLRARGDVVFSVPWERRDFVFLFDSVDRVAGLLFRARVFRVAIVGFFAAPPFAILDSTRCALMDPGHAPFARGAPRRESAPALVRTSVQYHESPFAAHDAPLVARQFRVLGLSQWG